MKWGIAHAHTEFSVFKLEKAPLAIIISYNEMNKIARVITVYLITCVQWIIVINNILICLFTYQHRLSMTVFIGVPNW